MEIYLEDPETIWLMHRYLPFALLLFARWQLPSYVLKAILTFARRKGHAVYLSNEQLAKHWPLQIRKKLIQSEYRWHFCRYSIIYPFIDFPTIFGGIRNLLIILILESSDRFCTAATTIRDLKFRCVDKLRIATGCNIITQPVAYINNTY